MKRKYMSEFGFHTYASTVIACYPNDLDKINFEDINYHIYMIVLIPKITINKDSLQVFEDHISLEMNLKTEEKEETETLEFSIGPINHKELNFNIDKPGKSLTITNDEGHGSAARALTIYQEYSPNYLETEIIYIGQSFGKNGERTAPQRLKSHSTLQRIQSELLYEEPERDLALVLLEFTPVLLSSMDGITKDYEKSDEEDKAHLKQVLSNPPTDRTNQIINITEAALINYFKPEYNEKFKDNFPDVEHKGYKQYYDLDYNAISVEIDPDAIKAKFYSQEEEYPFYDSIRYTLHPENIRKSMFDIFPKEDEETPTMNE